MEKDIRKDIRKGDTIMRWTGAVGTVDIIYDFGFGVTDDGSFNGRGVWKRWEIVDVRKAPKEEAEA
jgi:hypothetical protein